MYFKQIENVMGKFNIRRNYIKLGKYYSQTMNSLLAQKEKITPKTNTISKNLLDNEKLSYIKLAMSVL